MVFTHIESVLMPQAVIRMPTRCPETPSPNPPSPSHVNPLARTAPRRRNSLASRYVAVCSKEVLTKVEPNSVCAMTCAESLP
jgi:hypothetical protein